MKINKEPSPLFLIIAVIITREQTDLLIVFALFLFGGRNYEKEGDKLGADGQYGAIYAVRIYSRTKSIRGGQLEENRQDGGRDRD